MPERRKRLFSVSDYLTLGLAIGLAFAVWLAVNLSRSYSYIEQVPVRVSCNIPGHNDVANAIINVSARCHVSGFHILYSRLKKADVVDLRLEGSDTQHLGGDRYCVTKENLEKYFNDIFPAQAKLDYFVTDSLFLEFPSVHCRKLPVILAGDIRYADQFTEREALQFVPDSVLVYGNDEILSALDAVYTTPLHLSDVDGDMYGEVKLEPVSGLRFGVEKVNYNLKSIRYVQLKQLAQVEAVGVPANKSVEIIPSETMVYLRVKYPLSHRYENPKVLISYDDIVSSLSGKCFGCLDDNSTDILNVTMYPEVFECRITNN